MYQNLSRRPSVAALFRSAVAASLLLAVGFAAACEAQAPSAAAGVRPAKSWVLSLNQKVSVAARCNAMVETLSRMVSAGSALTISILGYDKPEGSRSLSLAYISAVTEELRALLRQKGKRQVRIQTVFGGAAENTSIDPEAVGKIEIRVDAPTVAPGG